MTRTFFGLILLANLAFFAYIRWGSLLTQADIASLQSQKPLNADKIRLIGFSAGAPATDATRPGPPAMPHSDLPTPKSLMPQVQEASNPIAPPPVTDACLEWGEFSGADLTSATADLASLNLGSSLTQRESEHTIGYWVYIPPLKNRSEVNKKISQLRKLGVNEFYVVQEKGKWQNTISLGVFKMEGIAQKFLKKLKTKGVRSAVMGERQTKLKFTVFILKNPSEEVLAKLAEWQKDFTDIGMKSIPCN